MSWLPKYESIDGIIRGYTPAGSLSLVPDFLSGQNYFENSESANGNAAYAQSTPTDTIPEWEGSYGSDGNIILDYAKNHTTTSNVKVAEIEVDKPEGATYYRQTISFTINTEFSHTEEGSGENARSWDTYSISIYGIQRRVYADPNSPGLVTHEWRPLGSIGGIYGNKNVVDPTESFLGYIFKRFSCAFGYCTHNDRRFFGIFLYANAQQLNDLWINEGSFYAIDDEILEEVFGAFDISEVDDPNEEPEPEDGPGGGGGGGGEGKHTLPDEGVPVPELPLYGAASVRWLTVYEMDQGDISDFGEELIHPTAWQAFKQFFTDPLDSIVGITLIPLSAPIYGTKIPNVGGESGYTWSRSFDYITNEFVEFDCGQIAVEPYWDSAFDFDPFTKFSLFLPGIGFKPIKADDIMGANVGIKYHVDVCTGDCVAFVWRSAQSESIYGPIREQVIGQYNGNLALRVPIGRVSHDSLIDAGMRLMAGGVGMLGGAIASAAGLTDAGHISQSQVSNQISGATMTAVNAMKQGIERSGAMGGAAGYMGVLKPYIIRSIPRQYLPDNYKQLNGYPANKGGTLNHFRGSGYQAIETIELDNLAAYDDEIDEILSLLRGGVLV